MAIITTVNVLSNNAPVLLVIHGEEGDWQFLCGTTNDSGDARIIGLGSLYERDPSLGELADLPLGWSAWRESRGSSWQKQLES